LPQLKYGKTSDDFQPFGGDGWIPCPDFFQNRLRDVEIEAVLCPIPPLMGDLLVGRNHEIPARASRQIAWDRGF
jgi:hypothetical protein